ITPRAAAIPTADRWTSRTAEVTLANVRLQRLFHQQAGNKIGRRGLRLRVWATRRRLGRVAVQKLLNIALAPQPLLRGQPNWLRQQTLFDVALQGADRTAQTKGDLTRRQKRIGVRRGRLITATRRHRSISSDR